MKLLLLLINIFSISKLATQTTFADTIQETYDEYALVMDYENNYYQIQLYAGKINDKIYYGISFTNTYPNQYFLKLVIDDNVYRLKENSRGDITAYAIDLSKFDEFSLVVYSKDGHYQYGMTDLKNLKVMDLDTFNKLNYRIVGNGNHPKISKITRDVAVPQSFYIYLAFIIIVLICATIVFIYYKKRKGMFSKELRSANVFNFKEFLNSAFSEEEHNKDIEIKDVKDADVFWEDSKEEDEEKSKVVHTNYVWQHYEEEKSGFDFKKHLQSLNLPIDYTKATLEEKNLIMIELMRLRDNNIITKDDYLDEITKLWKN